MALRNEFAVQAEAQQQAINELTQQVAALQAAAIDTSALTAMTAERDAVIVERDKWIADNTALRQQMANYLISTDGGQAALKEFKTSLLLGQRAAINAELQQLGIE